MKGLKILFKPYKMKFDRTYGKDGQKTYMYNYKNCSIGKSFEDGKLTVSICGETLLRINIRAQLPSFKIFTPLQ